MHGMPASSHESQSHLHAVFAASRKALKKWVLQKSARRVVHHLESIRSRPTIVGSGSARLSSSKAL